MGSGKVRKSIGNVWYGYGVRVGRAGYGLGLGLGLVWVLDPIQFWGLKGSTDTRRAPALHPQFPKEQRRTGLPSPQGHAGPGAPGRRTPEGSPNGGRGAMASLTPSPCWGLSSGEGAPLLPPPRPAGHRDRGGAQGSDPHTGTPLPTITCTEQNRAYP